VVCRVVEDGRGGSPYRETRGRLVVRQRKKCWAVLWRVCWFSRRIWLVAQRDGSTSTREALLSIIWAVMGLMMYSRALALSRKQNSLSIFDVSSL
jgi:hypothetical protein